VLEAGEQRLERRDAIFTIRYHDHAFPVSPRTLEALLGAAAEACRSDELGCTADALGSLPVSTATDRVTVRRRHRDKEGLGAQLTRLLAERPDVAEAVDTMISALNADPNALHTLLERQNYRLAFWRAAARDLGYRRFFDINTLVGLRMEIVVEKILEPGERLEAHQRWPQGMLATSTHDTKRSEDVRLRILLLSEIATCWAEVMRCGAALSEQDRRGGRPDRNTEYLLYQTLVGAWPLEVERALTYMEQAIREAKAHTSWTHTNADYEEAVHGVVTGVLADPQFTADLATFVAPLVQAGRVNGLAQTLLKLIAPGVPDLYQTTEVWHVSLVDPNNRRPVDYDLRRRLLSELEGATPEQMWARVDEGMPKQWLIRQALLLRHGQRERFGPQGDYQPLLAKGERAAHVVAFARGGGVVTVVPRLVLGLDGEWGSTTLQVPNGAWRNQLTGDDVDGRVTQMADLLARFPVALLSQKEGE
jgi:maltooligosyltrehalose synthase